MTGWRVSKTVLLFLTMALGLGAIGALLAAPTLPVPPIWYPGSRPTPASLIGTLGVILAMVALSPFAYLIYQRIRNRSLPVPQIFTTVFLVILLLLVGFVGVLHFFQPHTSPLVGTGANGTGPPPGGGTTSANGTSSGGSGPSIPGIPALPYWLLFVAVALAVLLFVGIAGPRLFARAREAEESRPDAPIREELELALRRMDSEPSTDPREIIRAMYARLLLHLYRVHGDTESLTPREISAVLQEEFHVRARGARELTRIFEQARYSTALLSSGSTEAMRRSLQEALEDLQHASPVVGR